MPDNRVRCGFYHRIPVGDQWRYEALTLITPDRNYLVTSWPPAVGDLIGLAWISDDREHHYGMFRVLDRSWNHSWWGSANFPYGKPEPVTGPVLDLIVEETEGLYRNEAPLPGGPESE